MTTWNVYAEVNGSPLYAEIDLASGLSDDEAFEYVVDEFRSTLQIDPL